MSRSELGYLHTKYKEEGNPLADSCVSGLIYKFWNVILHNYYKQGQRKIMSLDDCYDYVVDAIQYVLDKHVWTNPESSLYQDPNAPEKAINVRIVSYRMNFLNHQFRQKRKLNSIAFSLDNIIENSNSDKDVPMMYYEFDNLKEGFRDIIRKKFKDGEYLKAVILYFLIYHDVLKPKEEPKDDYIETDDSNQEQEDILLTNQLNFKFIKQHIFKLKDEEFVDSFATYTRLPKAVIEQGINTIYFYLDSSSMDLVEETVNSFKEDSDLIKLYTEEYL